MAMDGPRPGKLDYRRWQPIRFLPFPLVLFILLTILAGLVGWGGCGGRHRVTAGGGATSRASESADAATGRRDLARISPGMPLLIRVGLATELPSATLTTAGPTQILASDRRRLVASLARGSRIHLRARGGEVHWEADGQSGTTAFCFVSPRDPDHLLSWDDTPYRGEMLVLAGGGEITLVNIVELETYLQGVVPWEIGRPGVEAREAVAAQAVAARTYTISHLGEREDFGFDVWASVQDQVYRGAYGEDPVCNDAIAATWGLVLRSGDLEIQAYYSSTCGGWTSNIDEVWPRPARSYLISHRDGLGEGPPFCAAGKHFNWQVSWSPAELQEILQRTLPEYIAYIAASGMRTEWAGRVFTPRTATASAEKPGRLLDLELVSRTTSGRVARLDVTTESGIYHVRGDRIRWVLAPPGGDPVILRSALFELVVTRDGEGRPLRITTTGHGFGHGVGMCQEGALAMARSGYSSASILSHYYPGTRLESFAAGTR
jgi:stage II sporulation protein D